MVAYNVVQCIAANVRHFIIMYKRVWLCLYTVGATGAAADAKKKEKNGTKTWKVIHTVG